MPDDAMQEPQSFCTVVLTLDRKYLAAALQVPCSCCAVSLILLRMCPDTEEQMPENATQVS
jgi:hypothetical protein